MDRERAKIELMQIYGSLSSEKQMAIDTLLEEPNKSEIPTSCDDAISREAAIKAECEACDICGNMRYMKCQYFMQGCNEIECIRALPSVQPSRKGHWIDVNERLPEEYGEYMITWVSDYTNKPLISIAEYEITDDFDRKNCRFLGEWLFDEYMSAYTNIKVTAWMPLPEPYKADMRGDTDVGD